MAELKQMLLVEPEGVLRRTVAMNARLGLSSYTALNASSLVLPGEAREALSMPPMVAELFFQQRPSERQRIFPPNNLLRLEFPVPLRPFQNKAGAATHL